MDSPLGDCSYIKALYQESAGITSHNASIDTDAAVARREAAQRMNTPFMMLRPRITLDGVKGCAIYGENLQDGVAGFGDSPAEAESAFNVAWATKIAPKATTDTKDGGAK